MKKISNLLTLLIIAVLGVLTTACDKNDVVIEAFRSQVQKMCPISVDEVTTLTSVDFDKEEGAFVYNYTIDDAKCPIDELAKHLKTYGANLKAALQAPDAKPFLDACVERDIKVVYQYTGKGTGQKCWVSYNPSNDKIKSGEGSYDD